MLPYPPSTVSIKQFSFTDCSTIWVSLVMSLIYFLHICLVEFKLALFTRLHLFQHRYIAVFHKDRCWVIFFRLIHYPSIFQSLLSLTIVRSSIIQTLTIPNSRTLLLQLAFLASLTLCGFTPIIITKECKTDNKVYLNYDKTEIMIISTIRMSTSLSTQVYFATSNTPVPLYDTFNHLGVTLDYHLYFKSNISSTMSVQLTLHVVV